MNALVPNLSDRDRRRLVSTVALFDSDKDGEALAALRAASRLLRPHGVTFPVLVEQALTPAQPWLEVARQTRDHRQLARMCRVYGAGILNAWELGFLESITHFDILSAKQAAKLAAIETKIEAEMSR
jgi:hypothetical protein